MQFIEEYEARKALVASDRNARPASRPKPRHKADATQSPTRTVPRSRTVDRARVHAAAETTNRSKSRPRSSSAQRSKPVSTSTGTITSASAPASQAATLPRASAAAYTLQTESMNHARELEKEVERLRRELKAEARGRLDDAARRDEVESSRAGSMQATVAKLRVQIDASKRREEEAKNRIKEEVNSLTSLPASQNDDNPFKDIYLPYLPDRLMLDMSGVPNIKRECAPEDLTRQIIGLEMKPIKKGKVLTSDEWNAQEDNLYAVKNFRY